MSITVAILRRAFDHDGYCSGNECGASCSLRLKDVPLSGLPGDVAKEIVGLPLGTALGASVISALYPLAGIEDGPVDYNGGSGYCDTSENPWTDLGRHDTYDQIVFATLTSLD